WLLGTGQGRTHMVLVGKEQKTIFTSNVESNTISIFERAGRPQGPPGGPGGPPFGGPSGPASRWTWWTAPRRTWWAAQWRTASGARWTTGRSRMETDSHLGRQGPGR